IDAWLDKRGGELGAIARQWFEVMRQCGDEARELLHDGCPVAWFGDAPFRHPHSFTWHVNAGIFLGAGLPAHCRVLPRPRKRMRHVKGRAGAETHTAALSRLIHAAYLDIKARVENG